MPVGVMLEVVSLTNCSDHASGLIGNGAGCEKCSGRVGDVVVDVMAGLKSSDWCSK